MAELKLNDVRYKNFLFEDMEIISFDEDRKKVFKGSLLISNGYIEEVYDSEEVDYKILLGALKNGGKPNLRVIKQKNGIIMPGMVNCHTHIPMTFLRNYGDDMPLYKWLNEKIWPIEAKMKREHIRLGSELAIMELLDSGTTAFLDMYDFEDEIADVIIESGIRGHVSKGFIAKSEIENKENIKKTIELINKYHNQENGRLKVLTAPHAYYTNNEDTLRELINISKDYNVGLHIHLNEIEKEVIDCISLYGGRKPLELLMDLGLGEVDYAVLAHMVYLDNDDFKILENNKNLNISHNPKSNFKLGSGIFKTKEFFDKNIKFGLGTDGASSNNTLNMLSEMQFFSLVNKGVYKDPAIADAYNSLKIATKNGAETLAIDKEVGMLKKGYKADIVMFDGNNITMLPREGNIFSKIAYSSDKSDVLLTMVDGNILYHNGDFMTLDKEKIIYNFNIKSKELLGNV